MNLKDQIFESDYVHAIENFIQDLNSLQTFIERHQFQKEESSLYAGETMEVPHEIDRAIKEKVKSLLGINEIQGHGRIRKADATHSNTDATHIHLDHNCLVLIIFLSRSDVQGTRFYSHKLTRRKKLSRKSEPKEFLIDDVLMTNHYKDYSQWDLWHTVTPELNKAVLFDGHLYHSGPEIFESERITIDYFFRRDSLFTF